eukprot:CAMPEP_0201873240 /NCGR_PEP_ID=MMETSP0902-20130614/5800_1 /ASSEMBLY_ACC=CAM_ASM_000551 /TAXON_ID=420261 /ORGANISM="Thalassiosira antarctica, Strain CCMP982" /LENGTH=533 /DNA_ID=CAMNT_0048399783 /DNA_START=67 /DNA_END=1668 /DNA_ORIENTATION=-
MAVNAQPNPQGHRKMRSASNLFHALLLVAVFLLAPPKVSAKIASGKAHLSGSKTESTLVKFAVSPSASAKIDLNITSYGMYEDEKELRFRVYVDEDWPKVKRMPLCSDKVSLSQRAVPIVFDYAGTKPDDRSGKKKNDKVQMYTARIQHQIQNPPNQPSGPKKKDRSRYFYFVIDDCSLERFSHDNKIPDMVYTISVLNGRPSSTGEMIYEHLPADEGGMGFLMFVTIIISGVLAMLLFSRTIGGEVHVAVLVVLAACLTNGLSALCELIHRSAFLYNGHGTYFLDAFSSYFEAVSDSMVTLILLSIGGGWTLPSDVVGGGLGNEAAGNKLMKGVRNPAGSLLDLLSSGGGSGDKKGGIVALAIILVHVGLAQWGRTFDDDFDTYHGLEHPPGRALMILRFVLGLIFITGVGMVRSGGRCPPSLMTFLTKFGLVGLSYFASLPGISMFVGSVLPYYQRHQALHWGAAMVQLCCLTSLTWLFIGGSDASTYHRLSRVGKHAEGDLTESMAAHPMGRGAGRPSMWHIGKTKIRLD